MFTALVVTIAVRRSAGPPARRSAGRDGIA